MVERGDLIQREHVKPDKFMYYTTYMPIWSNLKTYMFLKKASEDQYV